MRGAAMNLFLPGAVTDLSQIEAGTCILFSVEQTVRVGVVIQQKDDAKSILDFERPDEAQGTSFHIYAGSHFENEPIVSLTQARIVPGFGQSNLGTGAYRQHTMGRALFLTARGPVVYAVFQRSVYKINLADGSIYQGDMALEMHTSVWRIEISDGAGNFDVLRDFTA